MHFTCDRYNSWAETKRLEFYLGRSISKAPYIINMILEASTTSHVVNLFHLYITVFQIIHENNDTSTQVGTSLTILSQQKPGSCICSNSQTKTSIFSLLLKQKPPKCCFSIPNCIQAFVLEVKWATRVSLHVEG
jgi:hypothetical protein